MTYDEAMQAASEGHSVRGDHFGPGWTVRFGTNAFWSINPHTGSSYVHTPNAADRAATWSIVAPPKR